MKVLKSRKDFGKTVLVRGVNLWGWEKNVECLIRYTLKEKTKRPFKMVSRLQNLVKVCSF
jgi:hypothetical protein